MSLTKINQLNQSDLAYGLRLEQLSINARGGRREKNRAFKSPVTQEEIDDYRKSLETPHDYTDPLTGETIKLKYIRPDQTVDIIPYEPIVEVLDEEQIKEGTDTMKQILEDITILQEQQMPNLINNKKQLEQRLNETPEFIRVTKQVKKGKTREVTEQNPEYLELMEAIRSAEEDLRLGREAIEDRENHVTAIQTDLRRNEENKSINEGERQRIKKENQEKIRAFRERMNELNRGAFTTEQQPNETEEEYYARLQEIAATPYDDTALKAEAEIYNIKKLKDNLKKLIRDDAKIESVIRNLEAPDIYQTNKIFNVIKQKFINVYGLNNPMVKDTTIIDFIKDALYFGKHGHVREREPEEINQEEIPVIESNILQFGTLQPPEPIIINPQQTFDPESLTFDIIENDVENYGPSLAITYDGIILFIKIMRAKRKSGSIKNVILFSKSGDIGSYREILTTNKNDDRSIYKLIQYLGLTPNNINYIFGGNKEAQIYDFFASKGLTLSPTTNSFKEVMPTRQSHGIIKDEEVYGLGLVENIPTGLVPFGRIKINLDKLYYKNMLSVRDKNGYNIPSLITVHVSDKFVDIIMKYIKKQQVKKQDFDSLEGSEKELLNVLLHLGGFGKEFYNTGDNDIAMLKNRLELVEGEIEAGNNNEQNFKELYHIIMRLVGFNALGMNEARKHLREIKKNYF